MGEVVGVLLAAGRGTRFEGGNKLLASVEGDAVVVRAARSLAAADHVLAILGHDADAVREALADHVDETTYNDDYDRGQSTSVRLGVDVVRDRGVDAAIFLPGDMPCVDGRTVDRLVETYRAGGDEVVVPTCDGRRGNPVLFDAVHFDALAAVTGDVGGRALFDSDAVSVRRLPVADPGVLRDVDTAADLAAVRQSESDSGTDDGRS